MPRVRAYAEALDDGRFEEAWERGRRVTLDEAVFLARTVVGDLYGLEPPEPAPGTG